VFGWWGGGLLPCCSLLLVPCCSLLLAAAAAAPSSPHPISRTEALSAMKITVQEDTFVLCFGRTEMEFAT